MSPRRLVSLLAVAIAAQGTSLVARLSPASIEAGKLTAGSQQNIYVSARVVDVAVGPRLGPNSAIAAGFILGERFPFVGDEQLTIPLVPSADAYVLWGPSLKKRPRGATAVAHVGGLPFGGVRFVNVAASVCWTLWAVCPELELSWRRVWSTPPDGYPIQTIRREDQFGLLVRVALGGWYEFQY